MIDKLGHPRFLVFLVTATVLTIQMPMAFTLGGLSGIMLAPGKGFTTLPISLQLLAGLVTVTPMSLLMGRYGRRTGFLLAAALTVAGGLAGMQAIMAGSFIVLCIAHVLLGASIATFALLRFAASEIVTKDRQPLAMSFALGTSLAAVIVAPQLFDATYDAMSPYTFAGAYVTVAAVAAIGFVLLFFTPLAPAVPGAASASRPGLLSLLGSVPQVMRERPRVARAILAGAATYAAMMGIMTAAPVAMVECGFTEGAAGTAISFHMIAMFAPSFFTGPLIAKVGAPRVLVLAFVMLAASAAVAAIGIDLWNFHTSLILLGIGWNFGYLGATAMLNAELAPEEKPLIQGINDTVVMLLSTIAAFVAGLVLTNFGWAVVAIVTVPLLLLLLAPMQTTRGVRRAS